jgi:hypothetical protein
MAAVTGLTLVKKFTYRDDPTEEWSNTYWLRNPPPGDNASWMVVATDLANLERRCYSADTSVVRAYGYDSNDDGATSVFTHDWEALAEALPGTGAWPAPRGAGDQAAMFGWKMDKKNSRGKYIYCRKYFHSPHLTTANLDQLDPAYEGALVAFRDELALAAPGTHGGIRMRKSDEPVIEGVTHPWVTTRTLKRRGKRPLTPA